MFTSLQATSPLLVEGLRTVEEGLWGRTRAPQPWMGEEELEATQTRLWGHPGVISPLKRCLLWAAGTQLPVTPGDWDLSSDRAPSIPAVCLGKSGFSESLVCSSIKEGQLALPGLFGGVKPLDEDMLSK